jgi:hypothetical protein
VFFRTKRRAIFTTIYLADFVLMFNVSHLIIKFPPPFLRKL